MTVERFYRVLFFSSGPFVSEEWIECPCSWIGDDATAGGVLVLPSGCESWRGEIDMDEEGMVRGLVWVERARTEELR